MSRRRFASYFLALAACATAAFSSVPAPDSPLPAPEDPGHHSHYQVASAR